MMNIRRLNELARCHCTQVPLRVCASVPLWLFCLAILGAAAPDRPRDPWVFRCVLDKNPRMVVIALHEQYWIAYDAITGGLYKAWRGGVKFDGAVYTTVHGPQPTSLGDAYFVAPTDNPWRVVIAGEEVTPRVLWRGYTLHENQVTLRYELILDDGHMITVTETPDVFLGGVQPSFNRLFNTSNVPPGARVHLLAARTADRDAGGMQIGSAFDVDLRQVDDAYEHIVVLAPNDVTLVTMITPTPTEQP